MPNGKPDDAERSPETLLALGPNWRDGDQPAVSSCDRIGRLCRGRGHSRRVGDRSMGSRLKEWRRECVWDPTLSGSGPLPRERIPVAFRTPPNP